MSATLAIRHHVSDYAAWQKAYDEAEPLRAQHGCTAQRVMRLPDDGNELFVTHDFPTAEQAGDFAHDPVLRETMGEPASRGRRESRSSRMSEPGRPPRRGRDSRRRPSPASLGVVRVDADFEAEYPGADRTSTEAYAWLCPTGEALLGELDRSNTPSSGAAIARPVYGILMP